MTPINSIDHASGLWGRLRKVNQQDHILVLLHRYSDHHDDLLFCWVRALKTIAALPSLSVPLIFDCIPQYLYTPQSGIGHS
jgi:hypothetical protein